MADKERNPGLSLLCEAIVPASCFNVTHSLIAIGPTRTLVPGFNVSNKQKRRILLVLC